MKISTIMCAVSLSSAVTAMDAESPGLQYLRSRYEEPRTFFWGRIAESPTGTMDCFVSYDSKADTYYGALHNNGYAKEEKWINVRIDDEQARKYFGTLKKLLWIKKNQ